MTPHGRMNHSARTARGKVKEIVGRRIGNRRMASQGKAEQVTSRLRHAAERGAATLRHTGHGAKGRAQEIVGSVTGNKHMKAKGKLGKASARISEKFNK